MPVKVRALRVDTGPMNQSAMTEAIAIPGQTTARPDWVGSLTEWLVSSRSHRVICLLLGVWVISGFDVVLTLLAHFQGMLDETNPIARQLLLHSPYAVLGFKVVLVTFASYILLTLRTNLLAEIAAGGMLVIYTIVAIRWRLCYELYTLTQVGDIRPGEIDAVDLTILTSHLKFF